MGKKIGIVCIFLGIACLLGAVGFIGYNRWEAKTAANATQSLLTDVQAVLSEERPTSPPQQPGQPDDLPEEVPAPREMATIQVHGYDCIGILTIPDLAVELPVLTDWSYTKLKKAPCLYYGSYYETDFVIAAHNYASHFGRLSELEAGDLVFFTDVNSNSYYYEVVLLETLPKEATNEMITSGFDLSLYTCTPGGANRVTLRCKQIETNEQGGHL